MRIELDFKLSAEVHQLELERICYDYYADPPHITLLLGTYNLRQSGILEDILQKACHAKSSWSFELLRSPRVYENKRGVYLPVNPRLGSKDMFKLRKSLLSSFKYVRQLNSLGSQLT